MKIRAFLQMLLFAGLPLVLSAVISAALLCRIRRKALRRARSDRAGRKANDADKRPKGAVAQWAENNKMSLSFGAAFLLMLLIAAGAGLICIKLSAPVQVYYVVCGIAMGAVAGAVVAFLMRTNK